MYVWLCNKLTYIQFFICGHNHAQMFDNFLPLWTDWVSHHFMWSQTGCATPCFRGIGVLEVFG